MNRKWEAVGIVFCVSRLVGCSAAPGSERPPWATGGNEEGEVGTSAKALTNCPAPATNQVVLWTGQDYTGNCNTLGIGDYARGALGVADDAVQSVQVNPNSIVEAVLFTENFSGLQLRVATSQNVPKYFGPNPNGGYPSVATSSVRVRQVKSCPSTPAANQVVVYTDANFFGSCSVLTLGEYADDRLMAVPNDSISSLKVGANTQVVLYQDVDFGGTASAYTSNAASLLAWNDLASSLKVMRAGACPTPAADEVVIWSGNSYTGSCSTLKPGFYATPAVMGLADNTMSSIRVGSNVRARAYSSSNFGGTKVDFTASATSMPSFDNQASSLIVSWAQNCPTPAADDVILYQNTNYSGPCSVLRYNPNWVAGQPAALGNTYSTSDDFRLPNNAVSSIKVGSNVHAKIYDGSSQTGANLITGNMPDLTSAYDYTTGNTSSFNDRISSLVVQERTPLSSRDESILVLLCKFADDTTESARPYDMTKWVNTRNNGGLRDWWFEQSGGMYGVSKIDVKGWYQTNWLSNQGNNGNRGTRVNDCIAAANNAGAGIDPAQYKHFVAMFNVFGSDSGADGWNKVALDASAWIAGWMQHEVGHTFGAVHPRHTWNMSMEYMNPWDVMSLWVNGVPSMGPFGWEGLGYGAGNRRFTGTIPDARTFFASVPFSSTQPQTIKLAPLNDPTRPGVLMGVIPPYWSRPTVLVEFRHRSGFDRNMARDSVFYSLDYGDGTYYLQDTNGAEFLLNSVMDFGDFKATVTKLDFDGAEVRIDPAPQPCTPTFCCGGWYCTEQCDGICFQ